MDVDDEYKLYPVIRTTIDQPEVRPRYIEQAPAPISAKIAMMTLEEINVLIAEGNPYIVVWLAEYSERPKARSLLFKRIIGHCCVCIVKQWAYEQDARNRGGRIETTTNVNEFQRLVRKQYPKLLYTVKFYNGVPTKFNGTDPIMGGMWLWRGIAKEITADYDPFRPKEAVGDANAVGGGNDANAIGGDAAGGNVNAVGGDVVLPQYPRRIPLIPPREYDSDEDDHDDIHGDEDD